MARSSNSGAFIVGTVLGGLVGAAAALWKTPQSGRELRQSVGLESEPVVAVTGTVKASAVRVKDAAVEVTDTVADVTSTGRPITDVALELVGQVTAPLVGVRIGQTANNSQPVSGTASTPSTPLMSG
jgi:gas vesicle protein